MTEERIQYIKNWIYRAKEDLDVIKSLVNSGIEYYTSTICFHAQQAVEKYLKAILIYYDVDFPRTHDVDFLLSEVQKIKPGFLNIDLKNLTEFGVSIRYPDDFYVPGVKETKEYIEIAEEVQFEVRQLLKSVIEP